MPYLCQEHAIGTDRMDATAPSAPLSPGAQELRQATRQFCAAKTVDNLRAVLDLRLTMQARTCALWVTSYDKDFTLRGTEWVSTQGLSGPCGIVETAVFSRTLYDSHGREIRFNQYRARHTVTKNRPHSVPPGRTKTTSWFWRNRSMRIASISTLAPRPLAGARGSLVGRNRCPPPARGRLQDRISSKGPVQLKDRYNVTSIRLTVPTCAWRPYRLRDSAGWSVTRHGRPTVAHPLHSPRLHSLCAPPG